MRKFVTAIFVPHAGCPHRCSFCDQNAISHTAAPPTAEQAAGIAAEAVENLRRKRLTEPDLPAEIAFFGGSFTAVPREYMLSLLEAVKAYVGENGFDDIRISTRPDAVDSEIIDILLRYGVKTVELGAQSSDGEVLEANGRGHSFADTVAASGLIRQAGLRLGLQMMTGLYRSTREKDVKTAADLLALKPDFMRVYPTAVFKNTRLYELMLGGEYKPSTVEQAVDTCSAVLKLTEAAGVPIVRLGLHADFAPEKSPVAGGFHPAFGQLCRSRIWRENTASRLEKLPKKGYTVYVACDRVSDAVGHGRENILYFGSLGYDIRVCADEKLRGGQIIIKENANVPQKH